MEETLQEILSAYDAWVIASRITEEADKDLRAMSAYILSPERRITMYRERRAALSVAHDNLTTVSMRLYTVMEEARKKFPKTM